MSTHTPGPWEIGAGHFSVHTGEMRICDIRGWGYLTGRDVGARGLSDDEAMRIQNANARLIAAAPDLLDALRGLLSDLEELVSASEGVAGLRADGLTTPWADLLPGGRDASCLMYVTAARAALAKAEGKL